MIENNNQPVKAETISRLAGDEPFEIIYSTAVRLYLEYGRFGKASFSTETEEMMEAETEALRAYMMSLGKTPTGMLMAVIDPTQAEELRQRGWRFYNLVLESLPASAH